MALRLIEIFLPTDEKPRLDEILKDHEILGSWQEGLAEGKSLIKLLLPVEETGAVLDLMEKHFASVEGFRILLLPVEASIPRPEAEEEAKPKVEQKKTEAKPENKVAGISRDELYADVEETAKLSCIVAAIGMLKGSVVAVIGAMVIAPLLGPNVALSLATTLGDTHLARRAVKSNAVGMAVALVFPFLLGWFVQLNASVPEVAFRTSVGMGDVVVGLAAGSAAALSLTTGLLSALIGVMVAVALLPPLVTLGMLMGAGRWQLALGALLLLLVNLICINLAGVVTFLARGIRPLTWWEEKKAKKATRTAISIWTILLLALVAVILLSRRG
jgi:uncharacterized hydrophobic protein (TIGR00341 family)